jgi:hypothetical protein
MGGRLPAEASIGAPPYCGDESESREAESRRREGGEGHSPGEPETASAEEKVRIVVAGLRGEASIAALPV